MRTGDFGGPANENEYVPQLRWQATSDALASAFDLNRIDVRELLDARFGGHLDEEFSHRQPADCQGVELIVHKLFRVRQLRNCHQVLTTNQPAMVNS